MENLKTVKTLPEAIKESLLQLAFHDSEEAILTLDDTCRVLTWTRGACELLGHTPAEILGTPFEHLLPPSQRERGRELLASLAAGTQALNLESSLLQRSGAEIKVRLNLYRLANAFTIWIRPHGANANEWKLEDPALREILMRLQQLGAVGQLSAALAHQIRTPLHVIQSTVEFIQEELPAASPQQDGLRVVNRNVERIAALTEALRGFMQARRHSAVPDDLNKVVEQACLFIEMLCKKKGIKLKRSLAQVPPVRLDADYLMGALYNLMGNAVDAMPDGGVLSVTTAPRGAEVLLTIADTGHGMPAAILEQIGRPFFTTKRLGTGLGVMVAKQILEQHGAAMQIESKHEVGTRVVVAFPAA